MPISKRGSVRVDLVGGTLDLTPIDLLLSSSYTINVATDLAADVLVEEIQNEELIIFSLDYQETKVFKLSEINEKNIKIKNYFGQYSLVVVIVHYFFKSNQKKGLKLTLQSGSPSGAGLGGSSAMGVTLFQALAVDFKNHFTNEEIIQIVKDLESIVLDCGPTGYQDYYPALFGGILALKKFPGKIMTHQLYTPDLKLFLEKNICLIYSGLTRFSAINNWEVFKKFFDQDQQVRHGLEELSQLTQEFYQKCLSERFSDLLVLIKQEGKIREKLFSRIVPAEVKDFESDIMKKIPSAGVKMCGAGGGGCFLLIHDGKPNSEALIQEISTAKKMKKLPFKIIPPHTVVTK
jgi:D-glycero-alpha-D-manno-heptose-7-phosphate kinase